jgi:hypothetical protein
MSSDPKAVQYAEETKSVSSWSRPFRETTIYLILVDAALILGCLVLAVWPLLLLWGPRFLSAVNLVCLCGLAGGMLVWRWRQVVAVRPTQSSSRDEPDQSQGAGLHESACR